MLNESVLKNLELRIQAIEWLLTSFFAATCVVDENPKQLLGQIHNELLATINERRVLNRPIDFVGRVADLTTALDRLVGMVGLRITQLQAPDAKG